MAVPKAGRLRLGVGVHAHEDVLSQAEWSSLGHRGQHRDLVGPTRIGQATLDHREPVLVQAVPVVTPEAVAGRGREPWDLARHAVGPEGDHVEPRCAADLPHMGRWAMVRRIFGL